MFQSASHGPLEVQHVTIHHEHSKSRTHTPVKCFDTSGMSRKSQVREVVLGALQSLWLQLEYVRQFSSYFSLDKYSIPYSLVGPELAR
eukprot:4055002-Amphidinium_carterae.2